MTNQLGSPPSRAVGEAFVEGVAALRRSILLAARPDDALRDIVSMARRQLRVVHVGVWLDSTRSWVTEPGADLGRLDALRSRADLRDGAIGVALVARGKQLGTLVGQWTPPSSLDLRTCAAFEELAEYAALALLTSSGGGVAERSRTVQSTAPTSPVITPARPVEPVRAASVDGPAGDLRSGALASPSLEVTAGPAPRPSETEEGLLADLRTAIMSEDIHPHFQPVIRFSDGKVVAFEALARWEHADRGWVAPGEFIPIAERNGLIASLGMRMLSDAARQSAAWSRSPDGDGVRIILNLSPVQLKSRSLVTEVGNVVRRHRLSDGSIVLELTNASFDTARMAGLLERFEGAGVRIAVADPDALSHLRASAQAVAACFVKVPRRLVGQVVSSASARTEIERLVAIGQPADVSVVAEGVETRDEFEVLRSLGVSSGLGFYWSPAVPAAEATALLRSQPWA